MGSISDMSSAIRSTAVMHEGPDPIQELTALVGKNVKVLAADYGPSTDDFTTVVVFLTLEQEDGTLVYIEGGKLCEAMDYGVCGCGLDEMYDKEQLRAMIRATITNTDNGMDDHDRLALEEELEQLDAIYGDG